MAPSNCCQCPSALFVVSASVTAITMGLAFASQWVSNYENLSNYSVPSDQNFTNDNQPHSDSDFTKLFLSMDVSTLFTVAVIAQTVMLYSLFCQKSRQRGKEFEINLSDEEIQRVIDEYEPLPLGAEFVDEDEIEIPELVFESLKGAFAVADGQSYLNFTSSNLLGLSGDPEIEEQCRQTIEKYGVGSCGPRGFYGTIDVHLNFEELFSKFMGTDESIIYSYDLATIPSVLPAFASKKDVMVIDEAAGWPIQNGAYLSRAEVVYFKHNDMEDLERCVSRIVEEDRRKRKPLNRRFIVVEGIYFHRGDLCPLKEVLRIKDKYKFRVVLDETYSFGVLGKTGRGATEHWGLAPQDIDILCGSMGHALGSVGGWCTAEREITDHQRLSGDGYCFSASLPPFLATAAIGALNVIDSDRGREELIPRLRELASYARNKLRMISGIQVIGNEDAQVSPLIHIQLVGQDNMREAKSEVNRIVLDCRQKGFLISPHRIIKIDKVLGKYPPSLRMTVAAYHTEQHIDQATSVLASSVKMVMKSRKAQEL
eukprot:TRINITY_DN1287_c0_g3_i1.p1 TRINITY_DN1287_c0_g3~~TRINITY_DN1287_c0_g3_i1.p1  ORF type:complete len:563 (-),score=76.62 TRINITY_DN1287_c0_g3_i1:326-1945(-)